jgi:hypothetical protein
VKRSFVTRLIDGLRGYGSRLDDYEMAIVEAVARELDAARADKLRRRARAINRVQRLLGGEDTTLYQMRRGRPVFPAETAILDQPASARFARVAVRSSDPLSRLKATIFLHDGNLSSIEFDRPSKFADAAKIDQIRVEILGPPFADPDREEQLAGDWPADGR